MSTGLIVKPTEMHLELLRTQWPFEGPLNFHRHVENVIYFGRLQNQDVVVRLTDGNKRSFKQLQSELDWQRFLMAQGAACAKPIPSVDGQLVESFNVDGLLFHACVFEKAPGGPLLKAEQYTLDVMRVWGQTVGQFHQMTQRYERPPGVEARPQWDQFIPPAIESEIRAQMGPRELKRYLEVSSELESLPRTADTYGLVHTDLHAGNFHWYEGRLIAFDFDDCCFHWFAYDLVIPIFYLRVATHREKRTWDLQALEKAYYEGYQSVRALEPEWEKRFRLFFSYRTLMLYGWCALRIKDPNLSEASLEWSRQFMDWVHGLESP